MLAAGHIVQGRYQVQKMLGEGGMGSVYLANDTRLPRQWALKELTQNSADPAELAEGQAAFMAEAQILAGLTHPNLPRVVDFFQEDGRHFLVMDFIAGTTLEQRLEKSPLSVSEALKLGIQIAQVLEYLHSQPQPVIFRDLKPANIILDNDNKPMLVDFGIARVFRHGAGSDTRALGTPGYAAPEQYGRGQSDHRTDLYALGATLHHCLSGKDPGLNPFHFEAIPHVPADLNRVLLRAVSLKAEDRFQSAQDVRQALEGVARSGALPRSSKTSELTEAALPPESGFQPPLVALGKVDWGGQLRTSLVLQGKVKGRLSSDSKWLKVAPTKVSGENVQLSIYADTRQLDEGGRVAGIISLQGTPQLAPLRVEVEVLPRKTPAWCWPSAIFLFLWSMFPLIGVATTPFLFATAWSAPRRTRGALSFLAWTSAFLSLAWVSAIGVLVGLLHVDWKAWLHSVGL
ncbi:serine/threonine protein kinase [bacterium]|nr:serine/threonine protein kinase [bacterium]